MTPTPRMQPENQSLEVQLARLSEAFNSFQQRLIGQGGIPGQLTTLETEFKDFREHLMEDLKQTVDAAVAPLSREITRLANEIQEVKGPEGFLAQQSKRIRALELWRSVVVGGLLVLLWVTGHAEKAFEFLKAK